RKYRSLPALRQALQGRFCRIPTRRVSPDRIHAYGTHCRVAEQTRRELAAVCHAIVENRERPVRSPNVFALRTPPEILQVCCHQPATEQRELALRRQLELRRALRHQDETSPILV